MASTPEITNRKLSSRLVADNFGSIFFWGALVCMCLPMLYPYFVQLWKQEHYRYFPFAFLAAGYLFAQRSDGIIRLPSGLLGYAALAMGFGAVALSAALAFPWFAAFGFTVIGVTFFASQGGTRDQTLVLVAVPLASVLQLPFRSDTALIVALQSTTTRLSSVLLDLIGVPHAVSGNVIGLASRELFVAEACSGIQSVFTLAFLATLIVAIRRRPLWCIPIYLLTATFLAVAANILRVSTIATADAWFEIDLTSGWTHELVGYVCLASAIGFLLSFDALASSILHRVEPVGRSQISNPLMIVWNWFAFSDSADQSTDGPQEIEPEAAIPDDESASHLNKIGILGFAALCVAAVVGAAGVVQLVRSERKQTETVTAGAPLFEVSESVVFESEQWLEPESYTQVRNGQNPRLGANADVWDCVNSDVRAQLVLSQPFKGWHELCVCYVNENWDLVDRSVQYPSSDARDSYAVARLKRDDGRMGYLFFSGIQSDGQLVDAPTRLGAFGTRFLHRMQYGGVWELEDIAMLQLWCVTDERLNAEKYVKLESDFIDFRNRIAAAAAEQQLTKAINTGTITKSSEAE